MRLCYSLSMKTALNLLKTLFRKLVLTPLDFLLFNGSGVLTLSREELRDALSRNAQATRPTVVEDDESLVLSKHGFPNYGLPDVGYGPWGEEFNFPPGGWADRG